MANFSVTVNFHWLDADYEYRYSCKHHISVETAEIIARGLLHKNYWVRDSFPFTVTLHDTDSLCKKVIQYEG